MVLYFDRSAGSRCLHAGIVRAHGESKGQTFTLWQAGDDVLGAVEYLQTRPKVDPNRIGVWGFSAGAATSVHAAAQSKAIQGVIADGLQLSFFAQALGKD